jgi:hypothetical protein
MHVHGPITPSLDLDFFIGNGQIWIIISTVFAL